MRENGQVDPVDKKLWKHSENQKMLNYQVLGHIHITVILQLRKDSSKLHNTH